MGFFSSFWTTITSAVACVVGAVAAVVTAPVSIPAAIACGVVAATGFGFASAGAVIRNNESERQLRQTASSNNSAIERLRGDMTILVDHTINVVAQGEGVLDEQMAPFVQEEQGQLEAVHEQQNQENQAPQPENEQHQSEIAQRLLVSYKNSLARKRVELRSFIKEGHPRNLLDIYNQINFSSPLLNLLGEAKNIFGEGTESYIEFSNRVTDTNEYLLRISDLLKIRLDGNKDRVNAFLDSNPQNNIESYETALSESNNLRKHIKTLKKHIEKLDHDSSYQIEVLRTTLSLMDIDRKIAKLSVHTQGPSVNEIALIREEIEEIKSNGVELKDIRAIDEKLLNICMEELQRNKDILRNAVEAGNASNLRETFDKINFISPLHELLAGAKNDLGKETIAYKEYSRSVKELNATLNSSHALLESEINECLVQIQQFMNRELDNGHDTYSIAASFSTDLVNKVESTRKKLDRLDAEATREISNLKTTLHLLNLDKKLINLSTQNDGPSKEDIEAIKEEIVDLKNSLEVEINERGQDVNRQLRSLANKLESQEEAISAIEASIESQSEFQETLQDIVGDIEKLNERVDQLFAVDHDEDINVLKTDLDSLKETITNMNIPSHVDLTAIKHDVNEICQLLSNANPTQNKSEINALRSNISKLMEDVRKLSNTQNARQSNLETAFRDLEQALNSLQQDEHESELAGFVDSIAEIKQDLVSLNNRLTSMPVPETIDLTPIQADVQRLKEMLANAEPAQIKAELEALQNCIDELRQELRNHSAAQAGSNHSRRASSPFFFKESDHAEDENDFDDADDNRKISGIVID